MSAVITRLDAYRGMHVTATVKDGNLTNIRRVSSSPLITRINEIEAQWKRPLIKEVSGEPRDPMKWRKRRNLMLWQQYQEARRWRMKLTRMQTSS